MSIRKLRFELVPRSMWGKNYRNLAPSISWQELRSIVMKDCCEVCGSTQPPFHCHEKWEFTQVSGVRVQKLLGLECCCVDCHDIHHIGRTNSIATKRRIAYLKQHYCRVNLCTLEDYVVDKHEVFEVWRERSWHPWVLDVSVALSILSKGGMNESI